MWSSEKPITICEIEKQGRCSVNDCCAIIGDKIIDPVFSEGRFNASNYLNLLKLYMQVHLWFEVMW